MTNIACEGLWRVEQIKIQKRCIHMEHRFFD